MLAGRPPWLVGRGIVESHGQAYHAKQQVSKLIPMRAAVLVVCHVHGTV
jgi:hypothetical protein